MDVGPQCPPRDRTADSDKMFLYTQEYLITAKAIASDGTSDCDNDDDATMEKESIWVATTTLAVMPKHLGSLRTRSQ